MTFREYLAARKSVSDSRGDFVRLALRDGDLPDIQSLRQLTAYMRGNGALSDLIEPASLFWAAYANAEIKRDNAHKP